MIATNSGVSCSADEYLLNGVYGFSAAGTFSVTPAVDPPGASVALASVAAGLQHTKILDGIDTDVAVVVLLSDTICL